MTAANDDTQAACLVSEDIAVRVAFSVLKPVTVSLACFSQCLGLGMYL